MACLACIPASTATVRTALRGMALAVPVLALLRLQWPAQLVLLEEYRSPAASLIDCHPDIGVTSHTQSYTLSFIIILPFLRLLPSFLCHRLQFSRSVF